MITQKLIYRHRGITLIEVMFAMGVMLVGVLGIAAVIPVAQNYARQTLESDLSTVYSAHGVAVVKSRKLYEPSKLWGPDDETGATAVSALTTLRASGSQAYCIDPWFLSVAPRQRNAATSNCFHTAVFPYYDEDYDPFSTPLVSPNGGSASGLPTTNNFPRMWRVYPEMVVGSGTISKPLAAALQNVFQNDDELSFDIPEDDNTLLPRQRGMSSSITTGGSTSSLPVKRFADGHYSWIATVTPSTVINDPNEVVLSVVVIRDRVFVPHPSNLASPVSYAIDATAGDDNPENERIAKVTSGIGFIGGYGGSIDIAAHNDIDNDVKVGEWILLSQNRPGGLPAIHLWYEVVNVTDPNDTGAGAWTRTLTLAGPDWPDGTLTVPVSAFPVFTTIVKNAIDVRQIPIRL